MVTVSAHVQFMISFSDQIQSDEPLPIASLRLLAPPLRLVSAAMWKVMQQRDAKHYGKLEEIVMSVSETVPGLLSYRHQAKLCVGLRARVSFKMNVMGFDCL